MENFFKECISMLKTPEVISSAVIFGIYFAGIKTTSLIKRLCTVAVLLQICTYISSSLGGKLFPIKSGIFDNFIQRSIAFAVLATILYYLMSIVAQKLKTIYKFLTD